MNKNHITIPAKNLEKTRAFYEKLGFEEFDHWERPERNLKGIWMKNDNGFVIELNFHPSNANIKFSEVIETQHMGIEVENLEEKIKKLKEANVEVIKPITEGITVKKFAFIKDPNGFSIELLEA